MGGPAPGDSAPVFAALADPTRRAVLQAISAAASGSATATELAGDLPVSRQAVVKHLQALADAGLVASERHGREQRYRVTPAPITTAMEWMATVGAAWDVRLARLNDRLAKEPSDERGDRTSTARCSAAEPRRRAMSEGLDSECASSEAEPPSTPTRRQASDQ